MEKIRRGRRHGRLDQEQGHEEDKKGRRHEDQNENRDKMKIRRERGSGN